MQLFRSHGITRNENLMTKKSEGDWYYQQVQLGFNYRMTELQAALGISQMQRLDRFIVNRHKLKKRYDISLDNLPIIRPYQDEDCYSALHLYPIQIDQSRTNKRRKQVFNELRRNGVGVNVHYIPIHTQPYYQKFRFTYGELSHSEKYYKFTMSLPMYSRLSLQEQENIVKSLSKALNGDV